MVIGHIPPAMDKSAWHGDIEVRQKFIPILNNARVDLMICAHTHRFSYHPHAEGINFPLVINSNKVHFFTLKLLSLINQIEKHAKKQSAYGFWRHDIAGSRADGHAH